ncbi:hypothetical protein [Nocardia sp. NPDC004750]
MFDQACRQSQCEIGERQPWTQVRLQRADTALLVEPQHQRFGQPERSGLGFGQQDAPRAVADLVTNGSRARKARPP